ncbi:MAG: von Willebrand factor type A domain-containing protein [Planctomycetota bacterium]
MSRRGGGVKATESAKEGEEMPNAKFRMPNNTTTTSGNAERQMPNPSETRIRQLERDLQAAVLKKEASDIEARALKEEVDIYRTTNEKLEAKLTSDVAGIGTGGDVIWHDKENRRETKEATEKMRTERKVEIERAYIEAGEAFRKELTLKEGVFDLVYDLRKNNDTFGESDPALSTQNSALNSVRIQSALAMLIDAKEKRETGNGKPETGNRKPASPFILLPPEEPVPAVAPVERPAADPKAKESDSSNSELGIRNSELEEESLPPTTAFHAFPVNPFVLTGSDRFSTFSLDVDTASYALARNFLRKGYRPPPASVRMEEFVNAFDYNYPRANPNVFGIAAEAAPAPFGPGLVLLKIGVHGKVIGREGRKPAHVVLVVDASGSMARPDRMPLVQRAIGMLAEGLSARDRVSLVTFGTRANLVLEAAPASDREGILQAAGGISCGGSTNLTEGLELGYATAVRAFRPGETNRVILLSDGVANVGLTEASDMLAKVKAYRDHGITFMAVGVGSGAYNDALLMKLADSGDGSYVFVDSDDEARRVFVENLTATLQTIAKDAKIQVEFDPRRVRRYRLIGYEKRDIADKDFRNDTIDAGEVGSGQSTTALYELELTDSAESDSSIRNSEFGIRNFPESVLDFGAVFVRYRDADTGVVEEISRRLGSDILRSRTPRGDPRFFLAAAAAEFAEILRGSEHADGGDLPAVARILGEVCETLPLDTKAGEILELVKKAEGAPQAP